MVISSPISLICSSQRFQNNNLFEMNNSTTEKIFFGSSYKSKTPNTAYKKIESLLLFRNTYR